MSLKSRAKHKAGTGSCYACGREVVWRKTEGGALSCFCQHCDFQGYAKDGTEAERRIMGQIGADPAPAAPAAPGAPGAPAAPAAQGAKSGAFGAFGL